MIAIWLPPSFIKFKKQTLVALSSINSKRMVGFQRFCLSVFTSTATNFLQCTHCWNFSFTHLALLLNFSHYDQQIIKNGKFKQPLRLSSTPTSSSCISHLFTPSLSTFLIQHKCCPDVRQQSLKEDIQNDKAIKEEERAIQKWLRENHREDAPPSFLPSFNPVRVLSPSIFSPSFSKQPSFWKIYEAHESERLSVPYASGVHFILIFNSCSFHIGDLPRQLRQYIFTFTLFSSY